jgi:protein TonB
MARTRGASAKKNRRWPQQGMIAVGALAAISLAGAMVYKLLGQSGPPKKPVIHQIALIKPPPPPKIEDKPPPETKKEEVKLPEPEKVPEEQPAPPAGEQLGVDGKANGSDGFGLASRPGGRDITTLGANGAGGVGSPYAWYSGVIQREVQKALMRNPKLRAGDYRVVVKLWFSQDGAVTRAELAGSSGQAEVDEQLRLALSDLPPIHERPPEGMPQPLRLRVTSRL